MRFFPSLVRVAVAEDHASYRVIRAQPPLAGPFEAALQRVVSGAGTPESRRVAVFAHALVSGEECNLAEIERLPSADQELCMQLFGFFLDGVTEEDRQAMARAFEPFAAMAATGTRH